MYIYIYIYITPGTARYKIETTGDADGSVSRVKLGAKTFLALEELVEQLTSGGLPLRKKEGGRLLLTHAVSLSGTNAIPPAIW